MYKVCKIRIYPNQHQIEVIKQTLGACRYVYNAYLEYNQVRYKETGEFLSGYEFAKILTTLKKNRRTISVVAWNFNESFKGCNYGSRKIL